MHDKIINLKEIYILKGHYEKSIFKSYKIIILFISGKKAIFSKALLDHEEKNNKTMQRKHYFPKENLLQMYFFPFKGVSGHISHHCF